MVIEIHTVLVIALRLPGRICCIGCSESCCLKRLLWLLCSVPLWRLFFFCLSPVLPSSLPLTLFETPLWAVKGSLSLAQILFCSHSPYFLALTFFMPPLLQCPQSFAEGGCLQLNNQSYVTHSLYLVQPHSFASLHTSFFMGRGIFFD